VAEWPDLQPPYWRERGVIGMACLGLKVTVRDSDMKAIESFHMQCQRRILGIRWHDFVPDSEVSLRTGLAPVSDWIIRGRNAIFGHVARLLDNVPAHQATLSSDRP